MEPTEEKKEGNGKRPSRLLNLNKSPQAQKLLCVFAPLYRHHIYTRLMLYDSATTNAARSPLLLLPPEIRCRIWDYAFSGCVFHISSTGMRRLREHHFTLCQSPQECVLLQFQHRAERISSHPSDREVFGTCSQVAGPNRARADIPLHMLQVCRQIYHEAVLKPFTQAAFHFTTSRLSGQDLQAFQGLLVPAQVKAIARFAAISAYGSFISPALLRRFEGLNHLDIHIVTGSSSGTSWLWGSPDDLEGFAYDPVIQALNELDLKSLRITTDHPDSHKIPVLEWIKQLEDEILFKQ